MTQTENPQQDFLINAAAIKAIEGADLNSITLSGIIAPMIAQSAKAAATTQYRREDQPNPEARL